MSSCDSCGGGDDDALATVGGLRPKNISSREFVSMQLELSRYALVHKNLFSLFQLVKYRVWRYCDRFLKYIGWTKTLHVGDPAPECDVLLFRGADGSTKPLRLLETYMKPGVPVVLNFGSYT